MGPLGLISGLKEPDLGFRGLGLLYGRTDIRTNVKKFTLVQVCV